MDVICYRIDQLREFATRLPKVGHFSEPHIGKALVAALNGGSIFQIAGCRDERMEECSNMVHTQEIAWGNRICGEFSHISNECVFSGGIDCRLNVMGIPRVQMEKAFAIGDEDPKTSIHMSLHQLFARKPMHSIPHRRKADSVPVRDHRHIDALADDKSPVQIIGLDPSVDPLVVRGLGRHRSAPGSNRDRPPFWRQLAGELRKAPLRDNLNAKALQFLEVTCGQLKRV